MTWRRTRLKHLCVDSGQYGLNLSAESYADSGIRLIRTSDITDSGKLRGAQSAVYVANVVDRRHVLESGDLLLSRSGSLGRAFMVQRHNLPATYAGYLVRFRHHDNTDPRFLAYIAASRPFQEAIASDAVVSTISNFNAERYANIRVDAPSLEDQRRIADFLDAETSRLDHLAQLSASQSGLVQERFDHHVDRDTRLGISDVSLKLVARVLPGYAFQSDSYSNVGNDVRLLRGTNVGIDRLNWDDVAYLPAHVADNVNRYALSPGDIVVGMDRPWIKGGFRIATVAKEDLPALLVQRVAVIRPTASAIDRRYLYWQLRSPRFQEFVSHDLTGLSVPHLSGPQIEAFPLPLPPIEIQGSIARRLDASLDAVRAMRAALKRRSQLLSERRQALTTAAVAGQIDVTTARGVDTRGL